MYAKLLFDPSQLSLLSPVPLFVVPPQSSTQVRPSVQATGAVTPLTVATCFQELALSTRQRMGNRACRRQVIPADFAQRQSTNGKFALSAEAWQIDIGLGTLQLRMVKIDGAKSNIINTWIFPTEPRCVPVYAAELIGVGDVVRVAFVDIQTPLKSAQSPELARKLKSTARQYQELPCDEVAPDWATDASLGHYTYARNVPQAQLRSIRSCYLDYLDLYLEHASSPQLIQGAGELSLARQTLHDYQLHHMQHSPGKKFLGNLFGVEWTDRFMFDFLFTQP